MRNSLLLLAAAAALAAAPALAEAPAAYLASVSGSVEVAGPAGPIAARAGEALPPGARVRTGAGGSAVIVTSDGAKILLRADTTFVFNEMTPARTVLSLLKGGLSAWVRSLGDRRLNVRSPGAVASVRGTVFSVATDGVRSTFDLFTGSIEVTDSFGRTAYATPGQRVSVHATTGLVGTSSLPPSARAPAEPAAAAPAEKPAPKKEAPKQAAAPAPAVPSQTPAPAPVTTLTPSPVQETTVVPAPSPVSPSAP